jgi:hypothetical protein
VIVAAIAVDGAIVSEVRSAASASLAAAFAVVLLDWSLGVVGLEWVGRATPPAVLAKSAQLTVHASEPRSGSPGHYRLKGPFSCLNEARYGIMWGAMGAARDAYQVTLRYALERRQFGQPVLSF